MKPPKCRNCGVEEWRHVCSGSVSSPLPSRATSRRKPGGAEVKPAPNIPNKAAARRTAAWRSANVERHREYMRGLMARRRAARRVSGAAS